MDRYLQDKLAFTPKFWAGVRTGVCRVLLHSLNPERCNPAASFDPSRVRPRVAFREGWVSWGLVGLSENHR